jgi:hypothetical protein
MQRTVSKKKRRVGKAQRKITKRARLRKIAKKRFKKYRK